MISPSPTYYSTGRPLRASHFLSFCLPLLLAAVTGVAAVESGVVRSSLAAAAADELAANVRQKAMDAYDAEEYETALVHLKEAYALNPLDAEVAGRLGYAAKESGAYELALSVLGDAVELHPNDYYYWWWLSDAQRLLGRYGDALKSMERARDLAPAEARVELQEYVAYTGILMDDTPSWQNFDQHLHFADRHRSLRRVRRQIEEYVNALDVAPAHEPDDLEALGRLGWVHQQLGIQYIYIEEPDVAIDYLRQSSEYARRAEVTQEAMRQEQFLAIAYRLKVNREPHQAHRHFESAVKHWNNALDLARQVEDVVYLRYVQGRLLDTLCQFLPLDDQRLVEVREANQKEIPRQGPVNEYSTAEAIFGEAKCRLFEGDYAGARILYELALPYFDESEYLSDYQRATELYLDLARIYFQQGHFGESLRMADKAADKAAESRKYVDADAFNRSAGEHALRHIAAARARAYIAQELFGNAFTMVEAYNAQHLLNLLGAKIVDDAARTDAASEKSVVKRRIPMLESLLEKARDTGDEEETARLEQRLVADSARLKWLERGLTFATPQALSFKPLPPAGADVIRDVLDENTAFYSCLFDGWGGVALLVSGDAVRGALLVSTEKDVLLARHALRAGDDGNGLLEKMDALGADLLGALAPAPEVKTLVVAPDENLQGLPMELLGGAFAEIDIVYTESASRLKEILEQPAETPDRMRMALGRPGMEEALCEDEYAFGPVACLRDAGLTLATIISDVQPREILHLGGRLDQTAPDALLCEMVFGDGIEGNELPLARLLGMKLPAALVVVDAVFLGDQDVLRSDVATVMAALFHYAGARAVLIVSPGVPDEVRTQFFRAFYANVAQGRGDALQAARNTLKEAYPQSGYEMHFVLYGDYR